MYWRECVENFMIELFYKQRYCDVYFVFFLYIISFGERMQRKTKALHNEHFIDNLLILKKKKKEELRERKRNVNISLKTIGLFV